MYPQVWLVLRRYLPCREIHVYAPAFIFFKILSHIRILIKSRYATPKDHTHTIKIKESGCKIKESNLQHAVEGLNHPHPAIPSLFFDKTRRKCYILIFHRLKYKMLRYSVLRQQSPEITVFFFFFTVFHTIHTYWLRSFNYAFWLCYLITICVIFFYYRINFS